MHNIKSLSDAIRVIHYFISERRRWERTKIKRNMICWRDHQNGMVGPRRIWITQEAKDVYRVRGGLEATFMKTVWPFEVPFQRPFKLTFHASEITREFIDELLPYVAASYAQSETMPAIGIFTDDKDFPAYAWSALAKAAHAQTAKTKAASRMKIS